MTKNEAVDILGERYEAMRLALIALPDEADVISIPPFVSGSERVGDGYIQISGSGDLPDSGIETNRYDLFVEHTTHLYGVPVIWLTTGGA